VAIKRRRWVIVTIVISGLLVAALVAMAVRLPISSPAMKAKVIETLADRLDSDVELAALSVRLYPRLHAHGSGLMVRHKGRTDVPPLISVDRFDVDADLVGLWRRHISRVRLTGLRITIPPGDDDTDQQRPVSMENDRDRRDTDEEDDSYTRQTVIDELDAPDAQLSVLRSDASKPARTWYMHTLKLRTVGMNTKMPFEAWLTNAVPPGQIDTKGSFGPWHRRDPGRTPLDGSFTFDNADLGVFNGISGTLSAHGRFDGWLQRIDIAGETDTPDFMVNLSRHEVPLKTSYHAIVDATNGNTTLDPVHAVFLDTSLEARGGVYEVEGADGRRIALDISIENGRIEDVMRLAVNTPKPPMSGGLRLVTNFVIPPGKEDVVRKLQLDGRFAIEGGKFTDAGVQRKINELSDKASAKGNDDTVAHVSSDFRGRFKLANGTLAVPLVTFDVPGAVVQLAGRYALQRETIDFNGNLFMDAKISQTTSGWKSFLLKMVDPLFRKNGKTVVPVKIDGRRDDPHFGVDVKRAVTRNTPDKPKR
jgi:hypothetical protein